MVHPKNRLPDELPTLPNHPVEAAVGGAALPLFSPLFHLAENEVPKPPFATWRRRHVLFRPVLDRDGDNGHVNLAQRWMSTSASLAIA